MTSRSHETIRVGLRRIIRDQNASPKVRLEATRLLMTVEGLMETEMRKNQPESATAVRPISQKLRELIEAERAKKTG